ncbi:MAG: hypothetical protein ACRCXZ_09000 [Patescibacteria group bacterium]
MKTKINIKHLCLLCSSFVIMLSGTVQAQNSNKEVLKFDQNHIISNNTFKSFRDFPSPDSIQKFLNSKKSILSLYQEKGLTAAQIIFKSANGEISSTSKFKTRINPAILIALIEKEQSLISLNNYDIKKDPERRLRSATGYGCPDDKKCDEKYYGFYNQVSNAAFQLSYNYSNASNKQLFPYNVGNTFRTLDGKNIKIENEATAALYRYTPHVFWGNYNLFKIIIANQWNLIKTTTSFDEIDSANRSQIFNFKCNNVFDQSYKPKETNNRVTLLQECLKMLGFFGNNQFSNYFGPITQKSYFDYLSSKKDCKRFRYKDFVQGQVSMEIRELQKCLIDAKLLNISAPTGFFGPLTNTALNKYKN